jgi:hypothetical protein
MQPNTQPLVIEGANHLILEFLKVGPGSASEILAAAEGASISARTIQRAAISLGVVKAKAGFKDGWVWRLPAVEGESADMLTEQPTQVAARVENIDPVKGREISPAPDAKVIAARLRRLEESRGKKAPIYAQDSRVMRWAELGIRDPDLREAYERAVNALEETRSPAFLTVGFLDRFVWDVMKEAA